MHKMKKLMTATLVTSMVMGGTLTAFAAETSGNTTGAGTSEGHVEKEVVNMVLPTIPDGGTPFAYTMDPERLIQETGGAKYEDYKFPEATNDTGVYFLVGDKEYANTSEVLKAINQSSCDVTLTVEVQATASAGGKDIKFATSATPAATGDPELYLGLTVGKGTPSVVSTTKATVTKTIAGTSANFETVYDKDNSKYVYQEKASATTWKAIEISMTGAVSKNAIAADTTAPEVTVTWSYEKAADGATVAESDQVDYTVAPAEAAPSIAAANKTKTLAADTAVTIPVSLGAGDLAAAGVETITLKGQSADLIAAGYVSYSDATITIPANAVNVMLASPNIYLPGGSAVLVVTFDDDAATAVEVTLNAPTN